MTAYQPPIYPRLEPRTQQFNGGRITSTDVLTLDEAAKFASNHAGREITSGDFLRAAARGEITLRAIVHRTAKLQKHDGGIYCNQGTPTENTAPQGAILTLPLSACKQLAAAGCAEWRTLDGFKRIDGDLMRFTVAMLIDGEPDFETVPGDCRVMGDAVHALADEYIEIPPAASSGAPGKDETDGDWIAKAKAIAQKIGEELWKAGQKQITARNIAGKVATELAKDRSTHGLQGPRLENNVRTVGLRGWKFRPPKEGQSMD